MLPLVALLCITEERSKQLREKGGKYKENQIHTKSDNKVKRKSDGKLAK